MAAEDEKAVKVLMVCLGICRSPMAEAVFQHAVSESSKDIQTRVVKIDSCGTGAYHVGDTPDSRTVETCEKHKVPIDSTARALHPDDFYIFTHILAMDQNNLRNIRNVQPDNSPALVTMFSSFAPNASSKPVDIVDPYYGVGTSGFERCYKQCVDYSAGFLDQLESGKLAMPTATGKISDLEGARKTRRNKRSGL